MALDLNSLLSSFPGIGSPAPASSAPGPLKSDKQAALTAAFGNMTVEEKWAFLKEFGGGPSALALQLQAVSQANKDKIHRYLNR